MYNTYWSCITDAFTTYTFPASKADMSSVGSVSIRKRKERSFPVKGVTEQMIPYFLNKFIAGEI